MGMTFQDLHELVRLELLRRIERGELTGSRLAQKAGFQQAHVSNFVNKRRSLSLEGLDRVLAAMEVTIDQLLPVDLTANADVGDPVETVPVMSASAAMEEAFATAACTIETIQVASAWLKGSRARAAGRRAQWQRFVAIRVDAQQTAAMEPLLRPGSIAVLDRHYNSLAPYHARLPTIFAVRCGGVLLLRFVDFDEGRLILRPYAREFPVQLLTVGKEEAPGEAIVGRVCVVLSEL